MKKKGDKKGCIYYIIVYIIGLSCLKNLFSCNTGNNAVSYIIHS